MKSVTKIVIGFFFFFFFFFSDIYIEYDIYIYIELF